MVTLVVVQATRAFLSDVDSPTTGALARSASTTRGLQVGDETNRKGTAAKATRQDNGPGVPLGPLEALSDEEAGGHALTAHEGVQEPCGDGTTTANPQDAAGLECTREGSQTTSRVGVLTANVGGGGLDGDLELPATGITSHEQVRVGVGLEHVQAVTDDGTTGWADDGAAEDGSAIHRHSHKAGIAQIDDEICTHRCLLFYLVRLLDEVTF